MFYNANEFNQNLNVWDVANVKNMKAPWYAESTTVASMAGRSGRA